MLNLIKHLTHQITATNQHGIHSPFVFDYVTKCLYKEPNYKTSKSVNILLKSIPYFKVESIKIASDNKEIQKKISNEFNLNFNQNPPFNLIYITHPSEELQFENGDVHNNSMIFVDNIHRTKTDEKAWEQLKNSKVFTVSIDLFYCGLLFFRKEQVKEHFKIRI